MAVNKVKTWDEVGKLAALPKLQKLILVSNPVYGDRSRPEAAPYVVRRVPQIGELDGVSIMASVRKAAEELD